MIKHKNSRKITESQFCFFEIYFLIYQIPRLQWLEKNVSETSNVVLVGNGGTDEKTGGGDGGAIVEDVTIFIRSDKNGQDQE